MSTALRRLLATSALVLAVVAFAEVPPLPLAEAPRTRGKDHFAFLAFGDSGTGGPGQKRVALSMEKLIAEAPVDFVLLLGDNFYPHGLKSASDPLFDRVFEEIYTPAKFPFPFYPVLGNHEYHQNAAACLKLGQRDVRWRMPARRYAFHIPLGATDSVLFLALDTTAIESPSKVTPDVDVRPPLEGVALELTAAAKARWRFVFGHHAMLSSGVHGESEELLRELAPVLAAGKVDLYICGHDHILESMAPISGVPQITVGGGGGWDRATPIIHVRSESLFRSTGGGFVRGEVKKDDAVFTFYDVDGVARHKRTLFPHAPAEGSPK